MKTRLPIFLFTLGLTIHLFATKPIKNENNLSTNMQSIHQRVAQIPQPTIPVYNATPKYNEFFTPQMESAVEKILLQMTLDEKLRMTQGDIESKAPPSRGSAGIDRLGIKPLVFYNGPRGMQTSKNATLFPTGVGQAATFRPDILEKIGAAISNELLARGWSVLEAPSMNIIRDPLNGRNFEYYTEDPYLNSKLTVAFVLGGQRTGAVNSVKHFLGNNKEQNRGQVNAVIDERSLHEIYLPAFKAACDAGVLSVMTGANRVNGHHASDNPMVISILKRDWGWPGFLYTDWNGVQTSKEAFVAGLDLSMPGKPNSPWTIAKLKKLYEAGTIDMVTLDDKVRRLLRADYFAGNLPGAPARPKPEIDYDLHHKHAYNAALASMVLVKNYNNILPLTNNISKIAIVGPMAEKKFSKESGGSSGVSGVPYEITALEGLKKRFGNKIISVPFSVNELYEFVEAPIVFHRTKDGSTIPGYLATYSGTHPNTGEKASITANVEKIDFNWEMASPDRNQLSSDKFTAKWTGIIVPPMTGKYTFRIQGTQKVSLELNGKLVSNKHFIQRNRETSIELVAGKEYKITVIFSKAKGDGSVQLSWITPDAESRLNAMLEKSVEAARNSDVAIVAVGLDHNTESEGMDRLSMGLPDYHNKLIERVLEANPKTIVLVYGGTPIAMDNWFEKVPALVLPWIPGIENGNALASLLSGDSDFGGRMPITFPKRYEDSPAFPTRQKPDKFDTIEHNEGIFVGYRWFDSQKIEPLIPFGHGLSYTTFEYGKPTITKTGNNVRVAIEINNSGTRNGNEVVQLYVHDVQSSHPRPLIELKAFESISIAAGEKKTITFQLDSAAFSYWNPDTRKWTLEPGEFEIQIGRSSRLILQKSLVLFQ